MSIDEATQPSSPPRHPTPRSPFPVTGLLISIIGILLLLLAFSGGFNVWFVLTGGGVFRAEEEAMRAERQAVDQRMQAEAAAEQARAQQLRAQQGDAELRRQVKDLQNELERTKQQLNEAKNK